VPARGALAGVAVAATADRDLEPSLASEVDDASDVAGVRDPHDGRLAAVDIPEEDLTHRPVVVVIGLYRRPAGTRRR
jgi:hypothetical protein